MSGIDALLGINNPVGIGKKGISLPKQCDKEDKETSVNFADTIKDFISAVNNNQKKASNEVSNIVQGKSEDLAKTMATLEEARISFQLMLEIRNKLLQSFKEIQRMQV